MSEPVAIRWTVGDVSPRGFQALRYSLLGAMELFGRNAAYAVVVNGISLAAARERCGTLALPVLWRAAETSDIPGWLAQHLAPGLAEGVAWKFAPLRMFPDRHELALDNDCILWSLPAVVPSWLGSSTACILAEDVVPAFGAFAALCGPAPRNTGIRGLPPGFDLGGAMRRVLARHPVRLNSELDEQGLQVAALTCTEGVQTVSAREVTICSPNPPHSPDLGSCGAHFVGLNVRHPRAYCDHATLAAIAAHWDRHLPAIARRTAFRSAAPDARTPPR